MLARKSGGIPSSDARARMADRRARRFLHHIAELARENNVLVSAWKQGRFDEQHVAAGLGPGQTGRDTGPGGPERHLLLEPRRAQIVVHLGAVDDRSSRRRRSARVARRPPPFARSCRAGAPDCGRRPRACIPAMTSRSAASVISMRPVRQPVLGHLPRQQILARDVDLLLLAVAGELDDFHAIEQRRVDRAELVGRGDEQHLREVDGTSR